MFIGVVIARNSSSSARGGSSWSSRSKGNSRDGNRYRNILTLRNLLVL